MDQNWFTVLLGQNAMLLFRLAETIAEEKDKIAFHHFGDGMHHSVVKEMVDALPDNAVIWTMNPLIIDQLRFKDWIEVSSRLIYCPSHGDLDQPGFTADQYKRFFEAYKAGVQRVSDILITQGLW